MINRFELERTISLEEAIEQVFGVKTAGRRCLLSPEAMSGEVAAAYDSLGKEYRYGTYQNLAADIWERILNPQIGGVLLDVGCGSGLLSWELAKSYRMMTGSSLKVVGIDLSADMIALAKRNQQLKVQAGEDENIQFREGSAYDLSSLMTEKVNYVICRNPLHRFTEPAKALQAMHNALQPGGKIYLRDLRRDANWKTVVERIGEERWQHPVLVQDYLAAMVAMLTLPELEHIIQEIGITTYTLTDGNYHSKVVHDSKNMQEYEVETEYVCIITK